MATEDLKTREAVEAEESGAQPRLGLKAAEQRPFTFGQRLKLLLAEWLGYLIVLLIGRSLRWEVYGRQNYEEAVKRGKSFIVTFWHREIFPAAAKRKRRQSRFGLRLCRRRPKA